MGGKADAVAAAFSALCKHGPDIGIHFGKKCVLARPSARCALVPPAFAGPQHAHPYLPQVTVQPAGGGFVVLKAPVGDSAFREEYVHRRVTRLEALFAALAEHPDSHVAYALPKACCSVGRVMWIMRTAALACDSPALRQFDLHVRRVFESIAAAALSDHAWAEARLGLRQGGVGLRAAAQHVACAFVASRTAAHALCGRMDSCEVWEAARDPAGPLAAALRSVAARVPQQFEFHVVADDPQPVPQKAMSAAVDAAAWEVLAAHADAPTRARMRSRTAPFAAAWLAAVPSPSLSLWFQPHELRIALCLWLGLPVTDGVDTCLACGREVDDLGAHALGCMFAGTTALCHNALRDALWWLCRAAGLRPELEKPGHLPDTVYRPADVFLPRYPGGGPAKIALDLAVCSPQQRRHLVAAGLVSAAAAVAYSDAKAERHACAAACAACGIRLIPMVVETFGCWAPEAAG
eukprot:gene9848-2688_t